MSRDLKQLASLNTVGNTPRDEQKQREDELQMFSNTTFFDLDMGRSTDIATTVDELLMQQEKQIQYPHKQQAPEDSRPVAGPSYTSNGHSQQSQSQSQPQQQHQQQTTEEPFDFTTLQGFSLAGELPQTSLSLYDVDPVFHNQHAAVNEQLTHHVSRPALVQRYEVAEQYAAPQQPKDLPAVSRAESESAESHQGSVHAPDDEKRKRNTAASARFRIKKKLREQEMEKNQRIMQQKLLDQEDRIKQLEMENTWLKNLVVERNTARDSSALDRLREQLLQNQRVADAQRVDNRP